MKNKKFLKILMIFKKKSFKYLFIKNFYIFNLIFLIDNITFSTYIRNYIIFIYEI